jgi:hypothetical protein
LSIAAGLRWTSTGPLGALLALGGFGVFLTSWRLGRAKTENSVP